MIKKIIAGTAIATLGMVSTQSFAVTGNVEATANFVQAITATPTVTMDFGKIGFTATVPTAGDFIDVGPNASTAAGGNLSLNSGIPLAGAIDIVASAGNLLIQCTATATLSDGTNTVGLININYGYTTTPGIGAGTACNGVNTVNVSTGGTDTISVGARLDGSTYSGVNYVAGIHNTTNANGVPIIFTVVYQ